MSESRKQPEDSEAIDASQFLPRGTPIITPEREAKGDIQTVRSIDQETGVTGDILSAQVQVRNILNFLWNAEIITDDQAHAGQIFQIWRDIHNAAMGFKKSTGSGAKGSRSDTRMEEHGYILLVQRLSRNDLSLIGSAIDTYETEFTRYMAINRKEMYRGALERLSLALLHIRDRLKALEDMPEDERIAHTEENLKLFVARFKESC
jgi:hypothetical protein